MTLCTSPDTTGERPPPCNNFSLISIDNRRAVLFGGENGEKGRMNDVYIINLGSMVRQLQHLVLDGLSVTGYTAKRRWLF